MLHLKAILILIVLSVIQEFANCGKSLILKPTKFILKGQNARPASKSETPVTKFMKFLQVIPDVIDEGPKSFLNVTYDSGVFADKGVELKPAQVANEPKVFWKAEQGKFYTLLMTDPDDPSREKPTNREWQHWLLGNIPGSDIAKGQVLTEYVGSAPNENTGLHRYVILLFKQPGKINFDEKVLKKTTSKGRVNFSTKKLIEKYKLGAPIAGNFFQAQYDDYVPKINAQFTD